MPLFKKTRRPSDKRDEQNINKLPSDQLLDLYLYEEEWEEKVSQNEGTLKVVRLGPSLSARKKGK